MKFETYRVCVPDHDCDVVIIFPGGKELEIQLRPSNGSDDYNGSLDIILPEDQIIAIWEGEDMQPSKALDPARPEERFGRQLVTALPDYSRD